MVVDLEEYWATNPPIHDLVRTMLCEEKQRPAPIELNDVAMPGIIRAMNQNH